MIRVASYYEMDAEQIESIAREKGIDSKYPFVLKINTKTGRSHSVSYTTEAAREDEIRRIVSAIESEKRRKTADVDVIRYMVSVEIDKLRPYLRRIEKILKHIEIEKEEET